MFIPRNFVRTMKVVIGFAILTTVTFPASGQQSVQFIGNIDNANGGEEIIEGLTAYQSGKLDEAIRHFKEAVLLNPNDNASKKLLADALTRKVIPGVETPDNLKTAQQAINLYQEVISKPTPGQIVPLFMETVYSSVTVSSMAQIARINFSINKLDDSKAWRKRVLDMQPKDAEASFAVGVIDWMQARQNALTALKAAGITDDGMGNAKAPAAVMESIKAQNGALIEESLVYLNQAVKNRPDYADAMAYLNLAYRRKADLDFGNETARLEDVARADEWVRKAMETRKANQAKRKAQPDSAHL